MTPSDSEAHATSALRTQWPTKARPHVSSLAAEALGMWSGYLPHSEISCSNGPKPRCLTFSKEQVKPKGNHPRNLSLRAVEHVRNPRQGWDPMERHRCSHGATGPSLWLSQTRASGCSHAQKVSSQNQSMLGRDARDPSCYQALEQAQSCFSNSFRRTTK